MKSKLVGKRAIITDPESIYHGEWGIIKDFDGEVYYIAIADGKDAQPVFDRDQFRVPRKDDFNGLGRRSQKHGC